MFLIKFSLAVIILIPFIFISTSIISYADSLNLIPMPYDCRLGFIKNVETARTITAYAWEKEVEILTYILKRVTINKTISKDIEALSHSMSLTGRDV